MKQGRYTDQLLRLIDGTLDPDAERELRVRIEQSAALRAELAHLESMQGLLRDTVLESSEDALKPFFTDRLMRQLEPNKTNVTNGEDLAFFLTQLFRPVAFAGCILALCLAAYNLYLSNSFVSETTTAEAILGLPPVSTMSVYDMDLYGVEFTSDSPSLP